MASEDMNTWQENMAFPTARTNAYRAPGKLGNPRLQISQDPRANRRLVKVLADFRLDRGQVPPSLTEINANSSLDDIGRAMREAQISLEKLYQALPNELPADSVELDIAEEREYITGPGNQTLILHVFRPVLKGGPLPCVVFFHCGELSIMRASSKVNRRWCISLATQGMVAIAVDFRNAWSEEGYNHFPAGLDDCCAAVDWIHSNKERLDIRNLVIHGVSGGANLALATAIRAKKEGWYPKIDGVYASSPTISNAYSWSEERKLTELPSLVECDGYFRSVKHQAVMARIYAPRPEDHRNPLAWPYYAGTRDLEGLPPHVIAMDELDPLRDEGVAYYRKLSDAGVRCVGHINLGHTHAASLLFRQALAEDNRNTIKNIAAFAKSV